MENPKPNNAKSGEAKPAAPGTKPAAAKPTAAVPAPVKVAPLFRKMDWLALGITFVVLWAIYLYTLAPELTLEDSGELCTGSFYAGIPHPPGYPFWAIYSWLWTLLPMGNVAWRVEVGESFAAAMGCGLVALMVSRGSSMLIEGIEELKNVTNRWENAIGLISGCVTGLLVGLDAYMWSESVVINRISLFGVPWLTVVLVLLLRWIYAPQQKRYLYLAMFVYGICATIHQSLLLSAMGIEVAIALANIRLGRDLFVTNSIIYLICVALKSTVPALSGMSSLENLLFHGVGISSLLAGGYFCLKTESMGTEWKAILLMGVVWALGVSFYFYEPLSGMTVPPMQWGYPRTVEGFFHALGRGQYESVHSTDIFDHPVDFFIRFIGQLGYIARGLRDSFSLVYMFIGLIPFLFLFKMQKRERAWIIGLTSIYFCLAVLMVIMLDVTPDRSATELNKVFFTASHTLFALMIGYGLTLLAAYVATHYQKFRLWGLVGGGIAIILALYSLKDATAELFFGMAGDVNLFDLPHYIGQAFAKYQYGSPVYANLILVAMTLLFFLAMLAYHNRGPVLILLSLFAVMPVYSGLAHWYKSEQRDHWFGYWFGHDMFTPPFGIYPPMTRDAILFGGTDPGRFCPTYMIFCESFIPHKDQPKEDQNFDRRDVYIITQNALADGTYLQYIRSEYNRSAEKDIPFFSKLFEYIVCLPVKDNPDSVNAVVHNGLVHALSNTLYYVLDVPFTKFGAAVEKRRRAEGVYPPKEIITPSPNDLQQSFYDYSMDVQQRQKLGLLKQGEEVHIDESGRAQVSGQVAVMMINGLLCKDIFDANKTNDFFVEESFPLDWMYPYETPSGIIMKINREPLKELTPDIFKKDHDFWTEYSKRLCGNWITYDTTVQQIADFAEKIYVHNNYEGFTGDPKFIRDDDGQKAFSKLRSSIAGVYAWRCFPPAPGRPDGCPPEYLQRTPAGQDALIKETEFAFKQAFAFCPYSPEAVYRYVNFLLQLNRPGSLDDALIVAQTCQKLDPFNSAIVDLVDKLKGFKRDDPQMQAQREQMQKQLQQMGEMARTNPGNLQNLLSLADAYVRMQSPAQAVQILNAALNNPVINLPATAQIAQFYSQLGVLPKLDTTRVVQLSGAALNNPNLPLPELAQIVQLNSQLGSLTNVDTERVVKLCDAIFNRPNVSLPELSQIVQIYFQMGSLTKLDTARVIQLCDSGLTSSNTTVGEVGHIANIFSMLNNLPKLQTALQKLVALQPNEPEARFDLARLEATLGQTNPALNDLKTALEQSQARLKADPKARDLTQEARTDPTLNSLRNLPAFQTLVPAK